MTDDPAPPRRTPQPPDQDAVNEHRGEGEGPFGADMTTLLGGTRAPGEPAAAPEQGNAYSTGTEAGSGGSLSPSDPRARVSDEGGGEEG
ncbi:hypothetical protein [Deinococcus budaensis]|uniref:Uncharacterized protein n=1 Tax=Deinococcus budaensis TaxID=1665626 RepID=A0A7W8GET6_9DEIO|nr:hypothetical protein [Deinococcus budaensis]MBB5233993.1 hypothetical protein [Deinococcus budaensis]